MPAIKSIAPTRFSEKIPDEKSGAAFARALAKWYRASARDLPWRTEPSLYKTVVSEFMLQQTQIATALPYFAAWLRRFPDFKTLAAAPEADVLKHWEGLGYYSRARNLQGVAKAVAAAKTPPATAAQWRALRGIGPYTAAAIASIACGERAALVDGNVVRVLTRLRADETSFASASAAVKPLQPYAEFLMRNAPDPGLHNQAMMELGALVCTRQKRPLCETCPVRTLCAAAARGTPERYPRLAPKPSERLTRERLWITDKAGRLLLRRTHARARRLASLWELPTADDLPRARPQEPPLAVKQRSISQQRITEIIRRAALSPKDAPKGDDWVWADVAALEALTLSGPHRKWVAALRTPRR